MAIERHHWWQTGVIYEVYPRSFKDSDGDGVGDLNGIADRLDYFTHLGIDAIWLCPIFRSPMADFGYDVADYREIDPLFGTMDDFERLLAEAHARGLKVILDFVPNHTSEQHPWFLESRASISSRKRDWYIWKDPGPDGGPPNNWMSVFGGSAWELDAATGQFYYHAFLKEQPDLNWRNPDVQEAMLDVLRSWFARGVDGFRIDVIWHLIKDERFRENPEDPSYASHLLEHRRYLPVYNADQPEVHRVIGEMRRVADEFDDRVLIGEIYLPIERLVMYYGSDGQQGVHLPFNFHLLNTPWQARAIAEVVEKYEQALPPSAWPNWVLGNHDRPRVASRIGPENARLAAMLLLTLRGTPTIYYGEELGMQNVPIPADEVQDRYERNVPNLGLGRDPVRTPMQWESGPAAGFSAGFPCLLPSEDYVTENVESQAADPRSMLSLYRRLLSLRRSSAALAAGSYRTVSVEDSLLAYERRLDHERFLVVLNLSAIDAVYLMPASDGTGTVVLSTELDREGEEAGSNLSLRPLEGVIVRLAPG